MNGTTAPPTLPAHSEVLIAGADPTGLTLAVALTTYGVPCTELVGVGSVNPPRLRADGLIRTRPATVRTPRLTAFEARVATSRPRAAPQQQRLAGGEGRVEVVESAAAGRSRWRDFVISVR
jgi:2-polyprenyl-6-methoxyphenol hydroxylase-like FAD-dependent oxidoreductase